MTDINFNYETHEPSPATNPDVQEALSLQYANTVVRLLPLRSGSIAVFGSDGRLHKIIDGFGSLDIIELRALSAELNTKVSQQSKIAEAARFYGEPDDKLFLQDTRDRRRSERPARDPKPERPAAVALDLDL